MSCYECAPCPNCGNPHGICAYCWLGCPHEGVCDDCLDRECADCVDAWDEWFATKAAPRCVAALCAHPVSGHRDRNGCIYCTCKLDAVKAGAA